MESVAQSNKKATGQKYPMTCDNDGAPDTIRTYDTRFRRAVLYPLSYGGAIGYSSRADTFLNETEEYNCQCS